MMALHLPLAHDGRFVKIFFLRAKISNTRNWVAGDYDRRHIVANRSKLLSNSLPTNSLAVVVLWYAAMLLLFLLLLL